MFPMVELNSQAMIYIKEQGEEATEFYTTVKAILRLYI